jgi:hypothetical protein
MLDFLQKTAAHFGLVITMASVCYFKANSLVFAKKVIWEATGNYTTLGNIHFSRNINVIFLNSG